MSKGLMKYKRVAMRLREAHGNNPFTKKELEDMIFIEIGTDPRTVASAIDRMIRLNLMQKHTEERVFGVEPRELYELTGTQDELF